MTDKEELPVLFIGHGRATRTAVETLHAAGIEFRSEPVAAGEIPKHPTRLPTLKVGNMTYAGLDGIRSYVTSSD